METPKLSFVVLCCPPKDPLSTPRPRLLLSAPMSAQLRASTTSQFFPTFFHLGLFLRSKVVIFSLTRFPGLVFFLMGLQDFRERVLQAWLEEQREGSDISVHDYEVALVPSNWHDRLPCWLLQQSRGWESRWHQVCGHVQHDVGEKVPKFKVWLFFFFVDFLIHCYITFIINFCIFNLNLNLSLN